MLSVSCVQSLLIMGIQVLVSKVYDYNHKILNHICCVWKIVGSSSDQVKPKTIKLVFVDSPLNTQ